MCSGARILHIIAKASPEQLPTDANLERAGIVAISLVIPQLELLTGGVFLE
jgi:hypothetical protein